MTYTAFPSNGGNIIRLYPLATSISGEVVDSNGFPLASFGLDVSTTWDLIDFLSEWQDRPPAKPTLMGAFNAMPVGTRFKMFGGSFSTLWTKVADDWATRQEAEEAPALYRMSEHYDHWSTITDFNVEILEAS